MNLMNRYESAKTLELDELWQLSVDVIDECQEFGYHKKDFPAWYMREKCYIPFSLVSELLGYSGSGNASRAVRELIESHGKPISLNETFYPLIQRLDELCDKFYGIGGNTFLERNPDVFNECMLLEASQKCGYVDNRRNGQWFESTPKSSSMSTYMLIKRKEAQNESLENILSDFHFTMIE